MAIPNEQAMNASLTGGVLTPASKNPNSPEYTELAGWFGNVLKQADIMPKSVSSGKRVALPNEERLIPKGTTNS